MKFLKQTDLTLANGGYLVTTEGQTPVNHDTFVAKQREAHALVLLANKVKGADFTVKTPVSFESLRQEVAKEVNEQQAKAYVSVPTKPSLTYTDGLAKEAMEWLNFEKGKSSAEKINRMLQTFNIVAEFEEFGLYFNTDSIVKLTKIYTIADLTEAMTVLEPHLD